MYFLCSPLSHQLFLRRWPSAWRNQHRVSAQKVSAPRAHWRRPEGWKDGVFTAPHRSSADSNSVLERFKVGGKRCLAVLPGTCMSLCALCWGAQR